MISSGYFWFCQLDWQKFYHINFQNQKIPHILRQESRMRAEKKKKSSEFQMEKSRDWQKTITRHLNRDGELHRLEKTLLKNLGDFFGYFCQQ